MDNQLITIDLNKLNTKDLDKLAEIAYYTLKDMNLTKQINDKKAELMGWADARP